MELCIDTATRWATVGLSHEGELLRASVWWSRQNHTRELAPEVQHLLGLQGTTASQLDGLVVTAGPGNFSALRVGMGFVKGLATSLGLPVVAVETLEVEALPFLGMGRPVCPVLDAGRGSLAWALYDGTAEEPMPVIEQQIASVEEVLDRIPSGALVCGEGVGHALAYLQAHEGPRPTLCRQPGPTRTAAALAQLGYQRLSAGQSVDPTTLQPSYLRSPTITQARPPQRIK